MQHTQIVLAKRPAGAPDTADFRQEEIILPDTLKEDELLLEARYFSVDPYLRGLMNEPKTPGGGFALNKPIVGATVAEVTESKSSNFKKGDLVTGNLPWATRAVANQNQVQKISPAGVEASAYLGILGLTGLTAYFGLLHVARLKAGQTVLISGAAGGVGNIAGQLAKIKGCKIVGLAGSDEKVKFLKAELGFDEVINYKTPNLTDAIKAACPAGVDIYFDNVGGEISDHVLPHLNMFGQVVVCGQISTYNNTGDTLGLSLLPLILNKSATITGYHVTTYQPQFAEAISNLLAWIKEGKLKNKETQIAGFEKLPEAFIGLFTGKNDGKMIVKV